MFSRFIWVIACERISFFKANMPLYVYTTFSLSFYLLIHIWAGFNFWLLWIMLQWHWCVQIPLWGRSFGYFYPEVKLLSHWYFCYFLRSLHIVFFCSHITAKVTFRASQVAQSVKNLPAVLETPLWSLGLKGPLEKEMANHSSILARKSHGQRSLVGCVVHGFQRVGHDWTS